MSVFDSAFLTGVTITEVSGVNRNIAGIGVLANSTTGIIAGSDLARLRLEYNKAGSVIRNLEASGAITFTAAVNVNPTSGVDTASSAISKAVAVIGITPEDDFTADAAAVSQQFDLGAIIPAEATVISCSVKSSEAITGTPTAVNVKLGNVAAGDQFVADAPCFDGATLLSSAAGSSPLQALSVAATNAHVTLTSTGGNIDTLTAGKWVVTINYLP